MGKERKLLEGITIAVDFDGTVVCMDYPYLGEPVPMAFEYLRRFKEEGAQLILWTMRSTNTSNGDVLTPALDFCKANGVVFNQVNENKEQHRWTDSPKAYATYYVDDQAIGCPLSNDVDKNGRRYVNWSRVGPLILGILVVGGVELPRICPSFCPERGKPFDQGNLCCRCPLFNCVGDVILDCNSYRIDWALAWRKWFDNHCQGYPDLPLEKENVVNG